MRKSCRDGAQQCCAPTKKNLVACHFGVDFGGPAIDATGHGFSVGNALGAEPIGHIETSHSVVAIENYVFVRIQFLEIRRNSSHGDKFGAFDAALRVFPGLANIHQQKFFAAVESRFYFLRRDFKVIHFILLNCAFRGDP
jgi:hypothetical protein